MKKSFLIAAVTLGMAWMLAACSGNTGAETSDHTADTQEKDQEDIRQENETQEEAQTDIRQENEPEEETVAGDGAVIRTEHEDESEMKEETGGQTEMKMKVQIGDYSFTAALENNAAVEELLDMMKEGPITIQMDDYSGFEKVGPLGRSLTTSNSRTTTSAGDIVLYNGNNIVMFYGSNSWSYTRIGKIEDLTDWERALGSGSITAIFTLAE